MRVLSAASELKPGSRKVCVAIGVFDGVLLMEVVRDAEGIDVRVFPQ